MANERAPGARAGGEAERLVAALCRVSLAAWRDAALAAAGSSRAPSAAAALDRAAPSCDAVRAWNVRDDLETALHRLSTHEALGIVRGPAERERIRSATRLAVSALLCGSSLAAGDARTLADPFLMLL